MTTKKNKEITVTSNEMRFLSFIGIPYYLICVFVTLIAISKLGPWAGLLYVGFWFIYDFISQKQFLAKVRTKACSKKQYAMYSLVFQLIYLSVVAALVWGFNLIH